MNFVEVSTLKEHEQAYIIPVMSSDEWTDFLTSVREKGILSPLSVLQDGRVLDGRHRLAAAKELGIEKVQVIYHDLDDVDSLEFIRDTATKRRNLTDSQKAAIVLECEELCKKISDENKNSQITFLKKGESFPLPSNEGNGKGKSATAKKLADIAGVSKAMIERVKQVKTHDPELYKEVKENKITAYTAVEIIKKRNKKDSDVVIEMPKIKKEVKEIEVKEDEVKNIDSDIETTEQLKYRIMELEGKLRTFEINVNRVFPGIRAEFVMTKPTPRGIGLLWKVQQLYEATSAIESLEDEIASLPDDTIDYLDYILDNMSNVAKAIKKQTKSQERA